LLKPLIFFGNNVGWIRNLIRLMSLEHKNIYFFAGQKSCVFPSCLNVFAIEILFSLSMT
jgi:hypothetical protein